MLQGKHSPAVLVTNGCQKGLHKESSGDQVPGFHLVNGQLRLKCHKPVLSDSTVPLRSYCLAIGMFSWDCSTWLNLGLH